MSDAPAFDDLERGHVVLAPDPFATTDDRTRPWVIANTEAHPFDGEQYVALALTTRTWYEHRVPLTASDYLHRRAPRDSSIVPHAITALQPRLCTEYVCRLRDDPVDRAVTECFEYLH